jgi:hypothetical protein
MREGMVDWTVGGVGDAGSRTTDYQGTSTTSTRDQSRSMPC